MVRRRYPNEWEVTGNGEGGLRGAPRPRIDNAIVPYEGPPINELFGLNEEIDDSDDVMGLIDENARDPTEGMQIDNGEEATTQLAVARAGTASSGGNTVSKETPISIYPTLQYGLPETHTCVLPWTGWCTMVMDDTKNVPTILRINMNRPVNYVTGVIGIAAGTVFPGSGIYNRPAAIGGNSSGRTAYPEPLTIDTVGVNYTQRPQWGQWYAKQYEYYTVLGTEYEIVMKGVFRETNSWNIVGETWDSFSDTATSTGNVIPEQITYTEALNVKDMKWHNIEPEHESGGSTKASYNIIKGRYKPGQVARNIVNDGDVKTWTKTNSSGDFEVPNLKEQLVLLGWRHPLSGGNSATVTSTTSINCQITLKQIVQFKDLRLQLRYPHAFTTGQDVTLRATADFANSDIRMEPQT